MTSLVVVIDTSALFPQTLRDVLLRAAEADLFRVRWSDEILDELSRNLREDRGLSTTQAEHLLAEMRGAFPEAAVTGYERLTELMANSPTDRHVLAVAVSTAAAVIVTENVRHFPESVLAPYDIEAQTSDDFLEYLFDLYPDHLARIVVELNAARKRPPEPIRATLDRLAKAAPRFATAVRRHPLVRPSSPE